MAQSIAQKNYGVREPRINSQKKINSLSVSGKPHLPTLSL